MEAVRQNVARLSHPLFNGAVIYCVVFITMTVMILHYQANYVSRMDTSLIYQPEHPASQAASASDDTSGDTPNATSGGATSGCVTSCSASASGVVEQRCFLRRHCMRFLAQPKDFCREVPMLFTFIFSLGSNLMRRQLVRETWANVSYFNASELRVVFIIGLERTPAENDTTAPQPPTTASLREEARQYNDVFLVDMVESFYNLTVKSVFGLHAGAWLCPSSSFVMKTDDDMLVNMRSLLGFLNRFRLVRGLIFGRVWKRSMVFRKGRYSISMQVFAESTYGTFCSGSGWIMSADVAHIVYELAMYDTSKQVVHLDDPYLTGILANKAGVRHVSISERYLLPEDTQLEEFKKLVTFTDSKNLKELHKYLFFHINDDDLITTLSKEEMYRKVWANIHA